MKRINVLASGLTALLGLCLLGFSIAALATETPTLKIASLVAFALAITWTGLRGLGYDLKAAWPDRKPENVQWVTLREERPYE